jgi:hypothetical protein
MRHHIFNIFAKTSIAVIVGVVPLISSAAVIHQSDKDYSVPIKLDLNAHSDMIPSGKGWGIKSPEAVPPASLAIPQNGINYHNGTVMGTTASTIPTVYFIWYGNWAGDSTVDILSNLARGIGASPYYKINSSYMDASSRTVMPKVNFGCGATDNYSMGTSLTDSSIYYIIKNAVAANKVPLDPNGIYFVLTSPDVKETSGFCTSFCGWHSAASLNSVRLRYSFIGNAKTQCPNACLPQSSTSPNNNPGGDGMASVFAHELEETVTDPDFSAWYDTNGNENADKCAWTFGATQTDVKGARYNMTINKMNYMIQQNWVNLNGGYCALTLPA